MIHRQFNPIKNLIDQVLTAGISSQLKARLIKVYLARLESIEEISNETKARIQKDVFEGKLKYDRKERTGYDIVYSSEDYFVAAVWNELFHLPHNLFFRTFLKNLTKSSTAVSSIQEIITEPWVDISEADKHAIGGYSRPDIVIRTENCVFYLEFKNYQPVAQESETKGRKAKSPQITEVTQEQIVKTFLGGAFELREQPSLSLHYIVVQEEADESLAAQAFDALKTKISENSKLANEPGLAKYLACSTIPISMITWKTFFNEIENGWNHLRAAIKEPDWLQTCDTILKRILFFKSEREQLIRKMAAQGKFN